MLQNDNSTCINAMHSPPVKVGKHGEHLRARTALVAIFVWFACAVLSLSGGHRVAAQSVPAGADSSYALRLVVTVPPSAGERQVYVSFGDSTSYALAAEGGGRYSLEAEAAASQNGAAIVLANSGTEERRDRITWSAYPGYKLTVEADYRLNPVGGMELDKVSQAVGSWAQVTDAAASGQSPTPNDLISGGQPAPPLSGGTGGGSGSLATNDTAPAWAGGGGSAVPPSQVSDTVTSTVAGSQPRTPPTVAITSTATTTNTTTATAALPPNGASQAQGVAGLINAPNVLGMLILLLAVGAMALPRLLRRVITARPEDEDDETDDQGYEADEDNEGEDRLPQP
jgi:hypothetical protein